ncbi:Serine/threonine-protein phosphatase 7 long form like [Dendrobium catenatum]|uniref:Serine/threonine-protein phosphatase 7 long form like n=1 Tax=Dendrobium catenatum TaxID=906689 RepID=A0A2I0WX96_9ASPA|nr:Serine/threonine-protein phosphatase 7 long form like [Dendrobium catenatum]
MKSDMVKLLCCFDGKLVVDGDDMVPKYVNGTQRPIKVERSSTLESLRRKVYEATGIDPLLHSLLLTCKYPIHGGVYRAVTLSNDEIVDCMIDESSMGGAIELYVEKEIILRQTSNHINTGTCTAMIEESAEPTGRMLIDKPVECHVNQAQGKNGLPRQCYHMMSMRDWPLTHPIMIDQLNQAGFLVANSLQWVHLDMHLLCALCERWHAETNTFHLRNVEITITLQDVSVLTGLVVDGLPVITTRVVGGVESRWATWTDCCQELLGRSPGEMTDRTTKLKLSWLRENFKDVCENASSQTVAFHTRAYIMHMLGSWVLPNRSGNAVPCQYLPLLENFAKCGQTAFGAASLAHLYRELGNASRDHIKRLAGNIHLLQLWAWERLKVGRSFVQERQYGGYPYPGPLGIRWQGERRHGRPIGHLMSYRRELDLADDRWVIWEPYPKSLLDELPAICTSGKGVWQSRVPLIHFAIVEMHVPDRVMRQFGMQQHPTVDVESVERIDARGKPGINWLDHHHAHIAKWGQRLQLAVNEQHKPELSFQEEHDRRTEGFTSHSMEDHESVPHNTQGHMEQDLINLCYNLRGRLNEHLLECGKPSLVYKMLADIDHTFGLYGLHQMLPTRECDANGPSSSSSQLSHSISSKTNPELQSSKKRPLSSSSSSKPPLFSALPAMFLQNRHEQMQTQQPFSLLGQSSKVDASSSSDSRLSSMKQEKGRGRKRGSTRPF